MFSAKQIRGSLECNNRIFWKRGKNKCCKETLSTAGKHHNNKKGLGAIFIINWSMNFVKMFTSTHETCVLIIYVCTSDIIFFNVIQIACVERFFPWVRHQRALDLLLSDIPLYNKFNPTRCWHASWSGDWQIQLLVLSNTYRLKGAHSQMCTSTWYVLTHIITAVAALNPSDHTWFNTQYMNHNSVYDGVFYVINLFIIKTPYVYLHKRPLKELCTINKSVASYSTWKLLSTDCVKCVICTSHDTIGFCWV